MFAFFSSRLGCLGSIVVSVIGTVLLILVFNACQAGSTRAAAAPSEPQKGGITVALHDLGSGLSLPD